MQRVETFDDLLKQACPPLDLDWRRYRRRAARHRVAARMRELGIDSWAGYLERLREDAAERAALPERMVVTISRFFRERPVWEALAERVLPELVGGGPLRALCIAACGGEEPYTLAILWRERMGQAPLAVYAVDVDPESLRRARAGIYKTGSLREVPEPLRERWFAPHDGWLRVADEARAMVSFERADFMRDALPVEQDLVLARYLPFTYYTGARREAAARRLHQALRPGGALLIGAKEAAPPGDLFTPWPDAPCCYRRAEVRPG